MAASKSKSATADKENYRQLRDIIYTFFYYSNKPVNMSEIVLQFRSYSKKLVESVIEDLVQKDKIFMKIIGSKTKIYCLKQEDNYEINCDLEYTDEIDAVQNQEVDDKSLRYLKWKNAQLKTKLVELKEESVDLDNKIAAFDNSMTIEEMKNEIEKMINCINSYCEISPCEFIDEELFKNAKKEIAIYEKNYKQKKKIFKEMVGTIADGLEMKKKDLLIEIGIEVEE